MKENKIKYHAYIQNWNGESSTTEHLVPVIEESFIKNNKRYTVINSSNNIHNEPNWINVGDIWYYRSFHEALKNFDFNNDYFLFITGDFHCLDWDELLKRSDEVLSLYKPKSFSVYHHGTELISNIVSLDKFEKDNSLEYVIIQDGLFVFYHKDVVKTLLEYFNYIDDLGILKEMKYGWGIDVIASAMLYCDNEYLLKDTSIFGFNLSSGCSDGINFAYRELDIFIKHFKEFCKLNNIYKDIDIMINRIMQMLGINYERKKFTYEEFCKK